MNLYLTIHFSHSMSIKKQLGTVLPTHLRITYKLTQLILIIFYSKTADSIILILKQLILSYLL